MNDLFESAGVEVPDAKVPVVERVRARKLVGKVKGLTETVDATYHEKAQEAEAYAREIGAFSVSRAIRWGVSEPALSKHGGFYCDTKMLEIARRYLRLKETA